MAATAQFTANAAAPAAVVAQSACQTIRVIENAGVAGFPTTDLLIYKGSPSGTPVRVLGGQGYLFQCARSLYAVGQVVGYVATVAGSTTIDQDEDQA